MILPPSVAVVPATAAAMAKTIGQIDQVFRAAVRAPRWFRVKLCVQQVSAVFAADQIALKMNLSALDLQVLALNQKLGHLLPCPLHKSRKCRTRDFHLAGRDAVILAFIVSQPNGFEFIESQDETLKKLGPHSCGLEIRVDRRSVDGSHFLRSGHLVSFIATESILCTYVHNRKENRTGKSRNTGKLMIWRRHEDFTSVIGCITSTTHHPDMTGRGLLMLDKLGAGIPNRSFSVNTSQPAIVL